MNDPLDLLDRLDDPQPFAVSPGLLQSAKARGRSLRRRHRARLAAVAMPIALVLSLLGAALYVDHRTDEVRRVSTAAGVLTPVVPGEPFNVLVVGTDGPRGQAGVRTDAIVVVRVDQAGGKVSIMSIPRDLSFDDTSRIDTVLGTDGPSALIQQIESHLGIPINHFVEIDEPGLAALVDQAGGVRLDTLAPLRDVESGVDLPAGCSTLDGTETVALARSRHLERLDGGTWTADPTSDLGREMRQRVLIAALAQKLRTMPLDASSLSTLLDVFADHTTVDVGFGRADMLGLAQWFHTGTGPGLFTLALPVVPLVSHGGADLLVPDQAQAEPAISSYLGGTLPSSTTTVPPNARSSVTDGPQPDAITLTPC